MFKPSDMNCGRGISMFSDLNELSELLQGYGRMEILDKKFQ